MKKLSLHQASALGMVAMNYAISNMPDSVVSLTNYAVNFVLSVHSRKNQSHDDFREMIKELYPIISPDVFRYSVDCRDYFSVCIITIPYE